MPAYAIVSYDIVDSKGFEAYVPAVMPLLAKHGAEVLVADFAAEGLEGQAHGVHVILKFPSDEALHNFHSDPDYAPVKQIRLETTTNNTFIAAKGFVPPTA